MPITSPRTLGVLLSGAALAGWLAGSTLSPPVAVTQVAPTRPVAAPLPRTELPHVAWPTAPRRIAPPAPSRNPFSFSATERVTLPIPSVASRASTDGIAAPGGVIPVDAPSAATELPGPRWRLSGIAASDDGDLVAVISGSGDVFLMRAGDELPGGDAVVEVGGDRVVVRTAAGPVTLQLP